MPFARPAARRRSARTHFGQRQKHPRIAHRAEVAIGAAVRGHDAGRPAGQLGESVEDRFALDFGGGDDQDVGGRDIGGRDIGGRNHRAIFPFGSSRCPDSKAVRAEKQAGRSDRGSALRRESHRDAAPGERSTVPPAGQAGARVRPV